MKETSKQSARGMLGRAALITGALAALLLAAPTRATRPGSSRSAATAARPETTDPVVSLSPASAEALEDKMRVLSSPVPPTVRSLKPIAITESEANSFLKYRGGRFLPPAVHDPELHIFSEHLAGDAEVDFNELNRGTGGTQRAAPPNDWAARALSAIFAGKQHVAASGKLDTANGQGRVTIESVTIGSVAVPPVLVDWLLQNYLAKRYNIDLSKPFALPDHVTHIELGAGRALLVRSPHKGQ